MQTIETVEALEAIYGRPSRASTIKVTSSVTKDYEAYIQASPFMALATAAARGMDCSPRGDRPGFVKVVDPHTLHIPDRKGNNRADSLRNVIEDPRVALLFFVPGSLTTLRISGEAQICIEPEVLAAFSEQGKLPRSVLIVNVREAFFQCGRALMRSQLWDPDAHSATEELPTPGQILSNLSDRTEGGETYDQEWPDRARNSLW